MSFLELNYENIILKILTLENYIILFNRDLEKMIINMINFIGKTLEILPEFTVNFICGLILESMTG